MTKYKSAYDFFDAEEDRQKRLPFLILHAGQGVKELVHATQLSEDTFRLESQPLDTPNVTYGDIVRAKKGAMVFPEVVEIVASSGLEHRIITGLPDGEEGARVIRHLSKHGQCEAVDADHFSMIAPRETWPKIASFLKANKLKVAKPWWQHPIFREAVEEARQRQQN